MIPCLTIAGSDCSGGAGIQADLKTFAAHGVYGMSVITAVTAQNTLGVSAIHAIPSEIVGQQLEAVLSDIPPAAIKIGMLGDPDTINVVAAQLKQFKNSIAETSVQTQPQAKVQTKAQAKVPIVLDPVMISSSGHKLISDHALEALVENLIPIADVITPNTAELRALVEYFGIEKQEITNQNQLEQATVMLSEKLQESNQAAPAIFSKGGHLQGAATDFLLHSDTRDWFTTERIDNPNTHGTGCTLSSAIAIHLAKQQSLKAAVENAKDYVTQAIEKQLDLGQGIGPMMHNL